MFVLFLGVKGKREEMILEEALLGVLGGLLVHVKAKVLAMSASSGVNVKSNVFFLIIGLVRTLAPLGP